MPPSILALIGSPYQALGLLEYVREHEITHGAVVLPRLAEPAMLRPTMNVLVHLRGFSFHLNRMPGFLRPGPNAGAAADEIVAIAREHGACDAVVIGDYRETAAWRVASLLGVTGSQVVVIDDGAATLAIDRTEGGVDPLGWTREAEEGGFLPQPAVTFFTSMPEALRSGSQDTVLHNDWSWLRARYRDLPRSSSLVVVVGQGFSRVKLTDEAHELELAHRLVKTARRLHPGANPLYVAHRGETVDKLRDLSSACDVVRFDVPLELVPVEARLLPTGVVGHYSTAMTSLASLVPDDLPVHAQRIDTDRLLTRGDYVADVYRRLESEHSGRITLVD